MNEKVGRTPHSNLKCALFRLCNWGSRTNGCWYVGCGRL